MLGHQYQPVEPHVLLKDWLRRPTFRRFTTLNEEQQSWPTDTKPTLKSMVAGDEDPHDKRYDWYISSEREQPNKAGDHHNRQLFIQDMEPPYLDTGGLVGHGKVRQDRAFSHFYTQQSRQMDKDWLMYPESTHRLHGGAPL